MGVRIEVSTALLNTDVFMIPQIPVTPEFCDIRIYRVFQDPPVEPGKEWCARSSWPKKKRKNSCPETY